MFDGMKLPFAEGDVSGSQRSINLRRSTRFAWRGAKWSSKLSGGLCLVVFLLIPVIWLCFYGEAFFSLTHRLPADVLVVEGWIDTDGLRAAAVEFARGGYKYIVATGGATNDPQHPSNYAEISEQELIRLGIPRANYCSSDRGN